LSTIFTPVPCKPQTACRKLVTEARVITSEEYVAKLKEKIKEDVRKKEGIAQRKVERKEKRKIKEVEKAQRQREREEKGRKKTRKRSSTRRRDDAQDTSGRAAIHDAAYVCKLCNAVDDGHEGDTLWVECDNCNDWVHPQCAGLQEEDDLESLAFVCTQCLE
jgi:hypothetical protein